MFEISKSNEQITIKANEIFRGIGVVCILMAVAGLRLIVGLLPFEEPVTTGDIFGLIFVCVWLAIVLYMGIFSFMTNSRQVILCQEGILYRLWFKKTLMRWEDVADWGLSYCGQTRGEGNTYHLYFSSRVCPTKNECTKILKGSMIKTFIMGDDYHIALRCIIPFCQEKTAVTPFIGRDKYHFL